ncbi:MAG: peptidoglycan-binding protein [Oscillospiraceae bacterium]|jgi:hypothetical protein|nr:peptidoglycan-binding protein [Oscillospiraceae bacterium]
MKKWAVIWLCCLLLMGSARADTGTVTASALVLRAGPGMTYAMLEEIPGGALLELLDYVDGWYAVRYGLTYGYVHGRYVRVNLAAGAILAPTPLPTLAPIGTAQPGAPLVFDEENNPAYPMVMKPGDMGNSVIDLQITLRAMGYDLIADGQYGYSTQAAVTRLQGAMGVLADGIVGRETRQKIGGGGSGDMELLDWYLGGNVAFARLTEASLVDARTGIRFRISRYGGDDHCDAEPLTAEDTRIFRKLLGGAWTWDRRPVFLEVNGRVIAASMNCMPHEGQHILGNDFDGHFCIHLLNSRTHDTDRVDPDHAACVQEAWSLRGYYLPY